jgi:uncharacterized DUF497 family protein
MQFAWDPKKATSNLRDHKVTFEEASSIFVIRWPSPSTTPIIPRASAASSRLDFLSEVVSSS